MVVRTLLVHRHRVRVERTVRFYKREERPLGVVREARLQVAAARHPSRDDVACLQRAPWLLQDEQTAAWTLPPAEVLRHAVVPCGRTARVEEDALRERLLEARIGQQLRARREPLPQIGAPAVRRAVPLAVVLRPLGDDRHPQIWRHPVRLREKLRLRARHRLQPREPRTVERERKGVLTRHGERVSLLLERPVAARAAQHIATVAVLGVAVHRHDERQ